MKTPTRTPKPVESIDDFKLRLRQIVGNQPKTGKPCNCEEGEARANCPRCEGTGREIDFALIRAMRPSVRTPEDRGYYPPSRP